MKYIDFHSHIFPPGVAEKVIDTLENYYHTRWTGTGELDDLLRNLRQAHITRSVIFSSATKPSQVVPINNFVGRLQQQYPPERKLTFMIGALQQDQLAGHEKEYEEWRWAVFSGLRYKDLK